MDLITEIFKNQFNLKNMITETPKESTQTEKDARKAFNDSYLSGDYDFLKFTPDCENTFVLGYALGAAMATEKSIDTLKEIAKGVNPVLDRGADNPDKR